MAAFKEHCDDCEHFLGDRCVDVNRWLDAEFKKYGPLHRFSRHHNLGIDEAGKLFGEIGRKAAIVHILKDCGHIPTEQEWRDQKVDSLGIDFNTNFNGHWQPELFANAVRAALANDLGAICCMCGKVISDQEWVVNMTSCAECLDKHVEEYYTRNMDSL